MIEFTDAIYESAPALFRAHGAVTPKEYAREAYKRTECGVHTTFVHTDGGGINHLPSADMNWRHNTVEWAVRHVVGIIHGTIVEGSDAEHTAKPLLFPFSDEELARAWQECEDFVDDQWESA